MSFAIGNVVILKSGGPLMTVTHVGNNQGGTPQVWCSWFANNEPKNTTFHPDALNLYVEDDD